MSTPAKMPKPKPDAPFMRAMGKCPVRPNESDAAFIARVAMLAKREPKQPRSTWSKGQKVTPEIKQQLAEILKGQRAAHAVNLKAIAGEVGVSYDVVARFARETTPTKDCCQCWNDE